VGGVGPSARAVTRAEVEPDCPAPAPPKLVLRERGCSVGVCCFSRWHCMEENGSNAVAVGGATPECVPLSTGGLLFFWFPLPIEPCRRSISSLGPPIDDTCFYVGQGHSFMTRPPRRVPTLSRVCLDMSVRCLFFVFGDLRLENVVMRDVRAPRGGGTCRLPAELFHS
jgi:hypothetical protein